MGSGRYSAKDWEDFAKSRGYDDASTSTNDIYTQSHLHPDFDPRRFKFRESLDSAEHPNSTPIILGCDVTGSMKAVLDVLARTGLKTACEEIYNRRPVPDPQICSLGLGDVACDEAPIQATQFESDNRMFQQLEKLWLEMGGGPNGWESYTLAWYFALKRTSVDNFRQRGKKGYIFTFGDEPINPGLSAAEIKKFFGDEISQPWKTPALFAEVSKEWEVFHLLITQGANGANPQVADSWRKVIGPQRLLILDDHTKLGEVIVSTLQLCNGETYEDVVQSWDGSTASVVATATQALKDRGSGPTAVIL